MGRKHNLFSRGDVIRTNPEKGFFGIAVVLDDGEKIELSDSRWSYPMCHIAVTPLIFQHEVSIEEIDSSNLKPLTFLRNYNLNGNILPYREEIMVHIYTTRNKANLPVIGKIDPSDMYREPLMWSPQGNRFFLYGDADASLGREAYLVWFGKNNAT